MEVKNATIKNATTFINYEEKSLLVSIDLTYKEGAGCSYVFSPLNQEDILSLQILMHNYLNCNCVEEMKGKEFKVAVNCGHLVAFISPCGKKYCKTKLWPHDDDNIIEQLTSALDANTN